MLDVIYKVRQIREYTEAGIILNHMVLFDELEELLRKANK